MCPGVIRLTALGHMTIKMAAPLRQTVVVVKYCTNLCSRQVLQSQACKKFQSPANLMTSSSAIFKKDLVFCNSCAKVSNFMPVTKTKLCNQLHSVYFSPKSFYCSSSFEDRKCWKCGAETNTEKELFFCNCGVVQEVPSDLNYFTVR